MGDRAEKEQKSEPIQRSRSEYYKKRSKESRISETLKRRPHQKFVMEYTFLLYTLLLRTGWLSGFIGWGNMTAIPYVRLWTGINNGLCTMLHELGSGTLALCFSSIRQILGTKTEISKHH